jgi:hypothetical protein
VKIYSNKEFSQLSEFSTKRTSSTRRFRKFVRTFYKPAETESKGVDESIERSELSEQGRREASILEGLRVQGIRQLKPFLPFE